MDNLFDGKEGLYWFFGTVESDADPLGLGRVRIRATGWHNEDYQVLKTEQLPWAYPLVSINDWAIGGKGKSINPPPPGCRVYGFFLDGKTAQKPVYTHTVPGVTSVEQRRRQEYGSRPWMPQDNSVHGNYNGYREGDNTSAQKGDTSRENVRVPDQRLVNIDPGEWVVPFSGFVSSAYGEARGAGSHNGVDICPAGCFKQTSAGASHLRGKLRGPTGLPVYAAAAGEVIYLWKSDEGQGGSYSDYDLTGPPSNRRRSYGNAIVIKHTLSTGTFLTIYSHLGVNQDPGKEAPGAGISVAVGDSVSKGQQIGSVGRSHVWDSPTHLHFEIREGISLPKANNHINPGKVFPQLYNRHTAMVSWLNSQNNYLTSDTPFSKDFPVVAGKGPK